jgi:hypothetical protein
MVHTPEHVHMMGTTFSWVLFEPPTDDPAPGLTAMVIDLLRKRYVVYQSEAQVPSEKMITDGALILKDGFRYRFSVRQIGNGIVEVTFSDYVGPEGASSQTNRYKWKGSKWVTTVKGSLLISAASPNPPLNLTGAQYAPAG